ncbi:hypothetical protein [Sporosarcina sp. ANT_H38]|nr:hypothetical protein [Sporosarcina sp. ANT_H38]
MKDNHTITEMVCRDATNPDILVIVLEVIQSKAFPKRNYTSAAGGD